MADSYVRVPTDSTGKRVDATSLDVGADTVYRQRIVIGDNSATAQFATVTGGALVVAGTVNVSAMPTVTVTGGVAVSGTAQVAISTPFTINNVSATVMVAITSGGGSGFSYTDGTPFTAQEAAFIPVGGVFDDATPGTVSEGDAGVARITTNRALHINLRDASGNELGAASATGVFVRTATVTLAAGAANIGDLNAISRTVQVAIGTPFTLNNISATVTVAGVVGLTAGTANIGFINNISATVVVAGNVNISATASVILAAGTANFGTLNDISRTVQVAVGTPFTVNNISATVVTSGLVGLTAGAENIGYINHISATVEVSIASPFTVNNISRTVQVAFSTPFTIDNISATVTVAVGLGDYTPAIMSTSHGPKCVTASTSANVTLVASPGNGLSVHITQLMVGNNAASKTLARIGTSASTGTVVQPVAADGGGFVLNFDPPWKLSASEAAVCSVKPNASQVYFTVNFYVAA